MSMQVVVCICNHDDLGSCFAITIYSHRISEIIWVFTIKYIQIWSKTIESNIFKYHYIILYYIILYCIVLYYSLLYCIVLYYITLYYIILYYIIVIIIMYPNLHNKARLFQVLFHRLTLRGLPQRLGKLNLSSLTTQLCDFCFGFKPPGARRGRCSSSRRSSRRCAGSRCSSCWCAGSRCCGGCTSGWCASGRCSRWTICRCRSCRCHSPCQRCSSWSVSRNASRFGDGSGGESCSASDWIEVWLKFESER